jgi:8-oxo-dGTP pyrophosphatase MutT (NUDIX family)
MKSHWKILSSKELIQSPWMSLREDTCQLPNGNIISPYYVIETTDWVNIVPFDKDYNLLMINQYRHPINSYSLEVPAGNCDNNETPVTTAKRELLEETGATASEFILINSAHANSARQNNFVHTVIALNTKQITTPTLEETEQLNPIWIKNNDIIPHIDSNKIMQGLHINSILLALRYIANNT